MCQHSNTSGFDYIMPMVCGTCLNFKLSTDTQHTHSPAYIGGIWVLFNTSTAEFKFTHNRILRDYTYIYIYFFGLRL